MSQTLQLLPGKYSLYITPPVAGVDFTGVPTPSVSYQWKKNGTAIAGQTNPLLTGVWVEQAGGTVDLVDGDVISIDVILTNPVQVTIKTIAATIDTAQPAPVIDPITIRQSSDGQYQTVASLANTDIGEQVVVASNVNGGVTITPPALATYQWRRGFSPIAGATSQVYTLQAADADSIIDCVVTATNSGGTTSRTASVIVGTLPSSGWTELTPSADSRLIYVSNAGDDAAAANVHGRGYYLPSDPEIGGDPTNPAGPIVAYSSLWRAETRLRRTTYESQNGTIDVYGGWDRWNYLKDVVGQAHRGFPDWLLLRRGDSFDYNTEGRSGCEDFPYASNPCSGGPQWLGGQTGGLLRGRSESEPIVITAWGNPASPRPKRPDMPISGSTTNMRVVSIEFEGGINYLPSQNGFYSEDVLVEDCYMLYAGGTNLGIFKGLSFRRCVVTGSFSLNHNQGLFVAGQTGSVLVEECVFDRNGLADDPQEPRSWRGGVISASTTATKKDSPAPEVYQYDNQSIELLDVTTGTTQASGTVAPAASEPIAESRGKVALRDVSVPIPSPSVPSNPHVLRIGIGRYYSAGQIYALYSFDVDGVFTLTGPKRIRVFNAVTSSWDEFDVTIGTREQPLRSIYSRNLYLSKYDAITVRGSVVSRNGGGGCIQMRSGGIQERNLFMWNEDGGFIADGGGGLYKDNVVLHDDHFLPPGGYGKVFGVWNSVNPASDQKFVMDGNIAAHFHRGTNGENGYYSRDFRLPTTGNPGSAIMLDNVLYRSTAQRGLSIQRDDAYMVRMSGNEIAVVSGGVIGGFVAAEPAAGGLPYEIDGNLYHSQSTTPFNGNMTFAQWQAMRNGLDESSVFHADFQVFGAAAGWTAPERDIVSYMESVDPNYVVNEDVYLDDDSSGAKQDVRRKVWEVLSDSNVAGNAVMTVSAAKQAARRYHAFLAFINRAKQNRKGAWDERWTAEAVSTYIREGFGKPPVTGPYDERPLATRLMDYTI